LSRAKRRADRIREEIDIAEVLQSYGYPVHPGGGSEEQFPCDLHGDGNDNKPSGRMYPDSNSWYCFACDSARDSIQTVREKEGVNFWDAVKILEKRYNLPPLPWEDEDEEQRGQSKKANIESQILEALSPDKTFDQDRALLHRQLDNLTKEQDLPMVATMALWEAYDKVCYFVQQEKLTELEGRRSIQQVKAKLQEKLKAKYV